MFRLFLITPLLLTLSCASPPAPELVESGVSWELAEHRARSISNVRYDVSISIPDSLNAPITGAVTLKFDLSEAGNPVVIDFNQPASHVLTVHRGDRAMRYDIVNNHIVLGTLDPGPQSIEIQFIAGEGSLNRNADYLYTLFVPDRASFALPLFDQPNLKARYNLTLTTPAGWKAVANGALLDASSTESATTYVFAETEPISSYLFSFAAGLFQEEKARRGEREMTMFHRETDSTKIALNREAIFDLHHTALSWMEDYTGIAYPFGKFDFALIPSFQYGGMEHPGAILYRQSSLMLDESATQNQRLGRASLIAHETAHMWFGDLVTMNWFDDVWTKEVFANFMAAKIVNPTFPEINHDLRFLLRHYPAAYEVDRTPGANPVRQPLENLHMAGTLYGAIIYQKAPIVMKQLELLVGEENFRQGMRQYLQTHRFSNASWNDLVEILDALSVEDLKAWSRVWVEEPGRPAIEVHLVTDSENAIDRLELIQTDPLKRGRTWTQSLNLLLAYPDSSHVIPFSLKQDVTPVTVAKGLPAPSFILPHGDGIGYGEFTLDPVSRTYLLENLPRIDDALVRGVAWTALWDAVLQDAVSPLDFFRLSTRALPLEPDELNAQQILSYQSTTFWQFLLPETRSTVAPALEDSLWTLLERTESTSYKAALFNAYRSVVSTENGFQNLFSIWRETASIEGLNFSESDFVSMSTALALRDPAHAGDILDQMASRIKNSDRKERFAFVRPALSPDQEVRDAFFESLKNDEQRLHEPWVLEALGYLHHPLRGASSEKYILPSLELLEEIQRTGDIFFPKGWLDATLNGYQTPSAAALTRRFLDANPNYPYRLRNKILQSADMLFRAVEIAE